MQIIRSAKLMQSKALAWRRQGKPIGFVPTMGYLHPGHISLVHVARKKVGPQGIVLLSLYVNPTQFGPHEDLSRYPRDFAQDRRLCAEAGVDALFFPTDAQMYPGRDSGLYSTYVVEESVSQRWEGASRPTHFRGVTTVVTKLFHLTLPDVAVFGAKDFQQATVIQRMTRDLQFHTRVIVAPTIRESDGLAMSSRNSYLTPDQRSQATCLWKSIQLARQQVRRAGSRKPIPVSQLTSRIQSLIQQAPEARIDYIAFMDPASLEPVKHVRPGVQLALAVYVGKTRLIDNARL